MPRIFKTSGKLLPRWSKPSIVYLARTPWRNTLCKKIMQAKIIIMTCYGCCCYKRINSSRSLFPMSTWGKNKETKDCSRLHVTWPDTVIKRAHLASLFFNWFTSGHHRSIKRSRRTRSWRFIAWGSLVFVRGWSDGWKWRRCVMRWGYGCLWMSVCGTNSTPPTEWQRAQSCNTRCHFWVRLSTLCGSHSAKMGVYECHFTTRLQQTGNFVDSPHLVWALQDGLRCTMDRVLTDHHPQTLRQGLPLLYPGSNHLSINFSGRGYMRENGDKVDQGWMLSSNISSHKSTMPHRGVENHANWNPDISTLKYSSSLSRQRHHGGQTSLHQWPCRRSPLLTSTRTHPYVWHVSAPAGHVSISTKCWRNSWVNACSTTKSTWSFTSRYLRETTSKSSPTNWIGTITSWNSCREAQELWVQYHRGQSGMQIACFRLHPKGKTQLNYDIR